MSTAQNQTHDVDDLTSDLTQACKALHPDDKSAGGGNPKTGDVGPAACGKQPKKRCHNCGKWGHNCNEGGNNNNNNKRGGGNNRNPFRNRCENPSNSIGGNPHRNLECRHCKKKGQIKKNCFELQAKKKREGEDISNNGEIALMAIADGLPQGTMIDIPIQDVAIDSDIKDSGHDAVSIKEGNCSSASACAKEICDLHGLNCTSV